MLESQTARRFTALAPIAMSLLALALAIEGHLEFGNHPPADEGWQAHLFQLLIVLQAPIVVLFVVSRWRSLRALLPVLAAQVFVCLLALGAVRYFGL